MDEAVSLRAHHRHDLHAAGRRPAGGHAHREPQRRADAGIDRISPLLPADRLDARRLDDLRRCEDPLAARAYKGAHWGDGANRKVSGGSEGGQVEGLRHRPRVRRSGSRRGRAGGHVRQGKVTAARRRRGPSLPCDRRVCAQTRACRHPAGRRAGGESVRRLPFGGRGPGRIPAMSVAARSSEKVRAGLRESSASSTIR